MSDNPYAPPAAVQESTGPALWNPTAAANWSVVFSPVFGSTLVYLNYKALGREDDAKRAYPWIVACIGAALLTPVLRFAPLVVILTWYFMSGRKHIKWVDAHLGSTYPRKSWGKPLLLGVVGVVALVFLELLSLSSILRRIMVGTGVSLILLSIGMARRAGPAEASAPPVAVPATTQSADAPAAPEAAGMTLAEAYAAPPGSVARCLNCDALMPRDAATCPFCSVSFAPETAWRNTPWYGEASVTNGCPECKVDIPRSATTCPECKVPFSATIGRCPNCDARIERTVSECPHCTSLLGGDNAWQVLPLAASR